MALRPWIAPSLPFSSLGKYNIFERNGTGHGLCLNLALHPDLSITHSARLRLAQGEPNSKMTVGSFRTDLIRGRERIVWRV